MLRIHDDAIGCCEEVGAIGRQIERRDRSLADQMRRAMASVCLNIAEGCGSQGKNQNARYWNALGSAREVRAALRVARAFRYVDVVDDELLDTLDRICATLYRIVNRRA